MKAEGLERRCLTDRQLEQLHLLAVDCEAVFGHGQDVEWALSGPVLHLLQIRPLTTPTVSARAGREAARRNASR